MPRERPRSSRGTRQSATSDRALLREAEALRGSRKPGYRDRIWKLLAQAAHLDIPARDVMELRQVAVSCLGDFMGREPTVLNGFPTAVIGVAVDDEGTELAVSLANGQIVRTDTATGTKQSPRPAAEVKATLPWARFGILRSGDGKRTAAIRGTEIVISDADKVGKDRTFPLSAAPRQVALSKDGQCLVASFISAPQESGSPPATSLQVWELASGKALPTVTLPLDSLNQIVFSPDGRLFGCACLDGAVLYQTSDLRQVACIRGLLVYGLSFSPDNQLVLIPSMQEDYVRLWSVATQQDVALLPHAGGPQWVSFSGNGRRIATASLESVPPLGPGRADGKKVAGRPCGGCSRDRLRPGWGRAGVLRQGSHDANLGLVAWHGPTEVAQSSRSGAGSGP